MANPDLQPQSDLQPTRKIEVTLGKQPEVVYPTQFGLSQAELRREKEQLDPLSAEISLFTNQFYLQQLVLPPRLRSGLHIRFLESATAFGLQPLTDNRTELSLEDIQSVMTQLGVSHERAASYLALRKIKKDIGGINITSRSYQKIHNLFGDVMDLLVRWASRISVIGNGLSRFPEQLSQDHPDKQVVAADLLHYRFALRDLNLYLTQWAMRFPQLPIPLYLQAARQEITGLLDAERQLPNLELAPPFRFSSDDEPAPAFLRDTSLEVNVMGPPFTTIRQQLSALTPGRGVLLSVYDGPRDALPAGWRLIRLRHRHEGQEKPTKNVLIVPTEVEDEELRQLISLIDAEYSDQQRSD